MIRAQCSFWVLFWRTFGTFLLITLAAIVALLIACGCCTREALTQGTPNLSLVDPANNIWRGGQPTTQGWEWLAKQGIKDVIKLNTSAEGSDQSARDWGMRVHEYPITTAQQLVGSPHNAEHAAFALSNAGKNVFVHCSHGQDRTGLTIAIYRFQYQHWDKAKAQDEMLRGGFHKSLHGLWEYWERTKQ